MIKPYRDFLGKLTGKLTTKMGLAVEGMEFSKLEATTTGMVQRSRMQQTLGLQFWP